jgi:hypothetical protein
METGYPCLLACEQKLSAHELEAAKHWYPCTRLHCITTQKITIWRCVHFKDGDASKFTCTDVITSFYPWIG